VIIVTSSFSKSPVGVQNVFRPHENEKTVCSNPSGLKTVFDKFRFDDGLVWTEGLTVGINLRFQISPA